MATAAAAAATAVQRTKSTDWRRWKGASGELFTGEVRNDRVRSGTKKKRQTLPACLLACRPADRAADRQKSARTDGRTGRLA